MTDVTFNGWGLNYTTSGDSFADFLERRDTIQNSHIRIRRLFPVNDELSLGSLVADMAVSPLDKNTEFTSKNLPRFGEPILFTTASNWTYDMFTGLDVDMPSLLAKRAKLFIGAYQGSNNLGPDGNISWNNSINTPFPNSDLMAYQPPYFIGPYWADPDDPIISVDSHPYSPTVGKISSKISEFGTGLTLSNQILYGTDEIFQGALFGLLQETNNNNHLVKYQITTSKPFVYQIYLYTRQFQTYRVSSTQSAQFNNNTDYAYITFGNTTSYSPHPGNHDGYHRIVLYIEMSQVFKTMVENNRFLGLYWPSIDDAPNSDDLVSWIVDGNSTLQTNCINPQLSNLTNFPLPDKVKTLFLSYNAGDWIKLEIFHDIGFGKTQIHCNTKHNSVSTNSLPTSYLATPYSTNSEIDLMVPFWSTGNVNSYGNATTNIDTLIHSPALSFKRNGTFSVFYDKIKFHSHPSGATYRNHCLLSNVSDGNDFILESSLTQNESSYTITNPSASYKYYPVVWNRSADTIMAAKVPTSGVINIRPQKRQIGVTSNTDTSTNTTTYSIGLAEKHDLLPASVMENQLRESKGVTILNDDITFACANNYTTYITIKLSSAQDNMVYPLCLCHGDFAYATASDPEEAGRRDVYFLIDGSELTQDAFFIPSVHATFDDDFINYTQDGKNTITVPAGCAVEVSAIILPGASGIPASAIWTCSSPLFLQKNSNQNS